VRAYIYVYDLVQIDFVDIIVRRYLYHQSHIRLSSIFVHPHTIDRNRRRSFIISDVYVYLLSEPITVVWSGSPIQIQIILVHG
jgi:hypothetical protein